MIRLGAWAAPVLAAFLVSACGEVRDREEHVDERAQEPAASEGQAGPILHLVIDGRSQTYLGSPSCMIFASSATTSRYFPSRVAARSMAVGSGQAPYS